MQFSYHPQAGSQDLIIEGESYTHLYKSRRTRLSQTLAFRNLKDNYLYFYTQTNITRHSATLHLQDSKLLPILPSRPIHIILAIIDSKEIQKLLPYLNEIGVTQLTLFQAQFSQKEKLDFDKLHKILINSSQQCGRSNTMHLQSLPNLSKVLELYPNLAVLDFGGPPLSSASLLNPTLPILIGPEGGLSEEERKLLSSQPTYSTPSPLILKSQTACIYIASLLSIS